MCTNTIVTTPVWGWRAHGGCRYLVIGGSIFCIDIWNLSWIQASQYKHYGQRKVQNTKFWCYFKTVFYLIICKTLTPCDARSGNVASCEAFGVFDEIQEATFPNEFVILSDKITRYRQIGITKHRRRVCLDSRTLHYEVAVRQASWVRHPLLSQSQSGSLMILLRSGDLHSVSWNKIRHSLH